MRFSRPVVLVIAVLLAQGCSRAVQGNLQDAQLGARVKTVLLNDVELGVQMIDVDVANGMVRLSGSVHSEEAERRAIDLARGVSGVTDVTSSLVVKPPQLPPQLRLRPFMGGFGYAVARERVTTKVSVTAGPP